jgi:hypothetical protein
MKFTIRIEKLFAAFVMGLLLGAYIHHDYVKWHNLGRDVFLMRQGYRFDRYMAEPGWFMPIFGSIIISFIVLGIYEFISATIGRLTKSPTTTT